jgi:hypothetical protein
LDLRFDESPLEFCLGEKSEALGAEELRRLEGIYFLVDVWKRRADLFAVVVCGDGIEGVWIVDHEFFGISDLEMEEAVASPAEAWIRAAHTGYPGRYRRSSPPGASLLRNRDLCQERRDAASRNEVFAHQALLAAREALVRCPFI